MEKFTIKDVIKTSLNELRSINVPASVGPDNLLNIVIPLARAMHNLEVCLQAEEPTNNPKQDQPDEEDELIEEEKVIEFPTVTPQEELKDEE